MPEDEPIEEVVQKCQRDGHPGFKYGESGKCYVYGSGTDNTKGEAKKKAIKQGKAIRENS